MSAFYDLASLVLVPSGYKAQKVYAQKPLTTDGQLTFSRASTATRVNSAGLIETVSSNVPRLDYLGSTCPKLQLEPSRTNLLQRSSEFGTSPWATAAATITADSVTSPDGTTNADTLTASGTGVQSHNVRQLISTTSGTVYAFSVFVKKGNTDWIMLRHDNGGTLNYFNINTGTKGSADASATIVPYGNGWYRCTVFHTGTGSNGPEIYLAVQNGSNTFEAAGQYAYIYGAQYEAGAYPTSLIPTTSAAVTRLADACSKTGISSLIGQTEGTLFVDMEFEGYDNQPKWVAFLGTGADYIGIYTTSDSKFLIEVATSGATQFLDQLYLFSVGQRYKLAVAYKANDFALYINGTQVATDNSGTVPATSRFGLEYNTTVNNLTARTYNQALLFKTRLTNAQLAELTAL